MNLTGIKDVDYKILNDLDDLDLFNFCSSNKEINDLCNDENFWGNRIIKYYGKNALSGIQKNEKYIDYYKSGRVKTYTMCKKISSLSKMSQLVVEDFYNPDIGFVNHSFTRDANGMIFLLLKIVLMKMNEIGELEKIEQMKQVIRNAGLEIDPIRRKIFDLNNYNFTSKDAKQFYNLINIDIGRPAILRNTAKIRPQVVRDLSPKPEIYFRLIDYIHKGFMSKQIPLDILWSEICNLPYILEYKF